MNRNLFKAVYIEKKVEGLKEEVKNSQESIEKIKEDMYNDFEAHHIAVLNPLLMDNQENCILLRKCEDTKELLTNNDYCNWLMVQNRYDELKSTDIQVVKEILKPIKKAIKRASDERNLKEVLESLKRG